MADSFPIYNASGVIIPAGAVVELMGILDGDGRQMVRKPTISNNLAVFINGYAQIQPGAIGVAHSIYPKVTFSINPADILTPLCNLGTKAGEWSLRVGQFGFVYVGGADQHNFGNAIVNPSVSVPPVSGSGYGSISGSGSSPSGSISGSGSSLSGSIGSASGSISSGSTSSGSGGTYTRVINITCSPVVSGPRVYFGVFNNGNPVTPVSTYYVDLGCCSCGSGSVSGSVSGSGSTPSVITTCCANAIPTTLTLTISGTGGGSFPMTYSGGNWDTGLVSLTGAGAGTVTLRLYCFGTWSLQNNTGSPNYTVSTITGPSPSVCSPFNQVFSGTLTGSGSYNGQTRTFTVTP